MPHSTQRAFARRVALRAGAALAAALIGLGGCASSRATERTLDVAPGDYAAAFDATREVLRSHRFTLERVDARSGVITTEPRFGVGLMNPLDRTQSTMGQEVRETLNQEGRRVRVVFSRRGGEAHTIENWDNWNEPEATPADAPTASTDAPIASDNASSPASRTPEALADARTMLDGSVRPTLGEDLREASEPLVMKVEVVVDRVVRPGRRIETSSIRHSSVTIDPTLYPRGMMPTYTVARERDDRFAARLAAEIHRAIEKSDR